MTENTPLNILDKKRFKLTSTLNKRIALLVQEVKWDSVKGTLEIQLTETEEFDAIRWFSTINERHIASQRSSFTDVNQDAIFLEFFNGSGDQVANIRFRNLKLMTHSCTMEYHPAPKSFGIIHSVVIEYKDIQIALTKKLGDVDDEWQEKSLAKNQD